METLNLKTTLNAYPKLSPSILKDYVTKDRLDATLENYVEEAPVDSRTYARKDEKWVPLKPDTLLTAKALYYGVSDDTQIDNESEIMALEVSEILSPDVKSYTIDYALPRNGYLWIVCTEPIRSIIWGVMGLIADYEKQQAVIESSNGSTSYYCYRIRDELIAGQQVFLINF